MATFPRRLYPLKIALVMVGLTCSFSLPASSQPVPDPLRGEPSGAAVAVTPPLQPSKNVEPPRIRPPAIPEKPITVQPNLLPSKSVAVFPQFDGDGFFFVPSRTEARLGSANKVFQNVVIPFLSAIGFKNPATRFRPFDARYQGRELPKADLKALVKITCGQWWIQNDEKVQQSCTSLSKPSNQTSEADASFKTGIGMTVRQFKDALERVEVEYFFTQERKVKATEHPNILDIPQMVPLEHTGIRVEGRKGQRGLFVTGRVINSDVNVTNVITIRPDAVLTAARKALTKIKGISSVNDNLLAPVELLLLPYGGSGGVVDQPALKYAYRTVLLADFLGMKGTFYLWLDAGTGEILQLVPTMGSATATGYTFIRDPSSLPYTGPAKNFNIDPPVGGQFTLKLSGVFSRLAWNGDSSYANGEVNSPSKEFDQASFSKMPTAQSVACRDGIDREFAQVDLMATISRYREFFNNAAPVLSQFPRTERIIFFDHRITGCDAKTVADGFLFGLCTGYSGGAGANCLDFGDLNPAHDHTVVAHEFGHVFTPYQYGYPVDPMVNPPQPGDRLTSWCLGTTLEDPQRPNGTIGDPCPKATNPNDVFHDFADVWTQLLENTNCFGGWVAKNRGGTDVSKDCKAGHSELNDWPRLSKVSLDHFPEHRVVVPITPTNAGFMPYSDMQIAAAALWAVRQGLKSREPIMGELLHYTRFVRTLATTGWLGTLDQVEVPPAGSHVFIYTDRSIYRSLVELEVKLANRWARFISPGESTVNKVVSGFAKAGIFMIPWGCLDGDAATPVGSPCESGADAVIDVEPGEDYIDRSGSPPMFHIWTGPLYKFDGNNAASTFSPSAATPSPCNTDFEVEIASDRNFTPANTRTSTPVSGVWKTVSNTSPSGCHATWQPDASDWNLLEGTSGETDVYYRVSTRKSGGGDVRISTSPAKDLFGDFEPPYVVVNDSIGSDTSAPSIPSNLTASAVSSSQINLAWSPSIDDVGVAGYKVLRNGTEVGSVATTSYNDTGLTPSTTYTYTVRAFDVAGNLSAQSAGVSASTLPQSSGGSDFSARCAAPGVLVCRGFDAPVEFTPAAWPLTGLYPAGDGLNHGSLDSVTKASGGGSLRFEINGGTQPNSAGFWREAFTRTFVPGETFYVAFRQRFSPGMTLVSFGGTGWKQVIFHESEATCAGIGLTTANTGYKNFPSMSSNCGANRLEIPQGGDVFLEQGDTAATGYNCRQSNPTISTCAYYKENQWITFSYEIKVGNWGQPNTSVKAWIGYEGQPLKQWINIGNHALLPEVPGIGFDYLTLTPYDSGKDGRSHATAITWYDELIISTQPISFPNNNDQVAPAAPVDLRVH